MTVTTADRERKQRLVEAFRRDELDVIWADPKLRQDLDDEAASLPVEDRLVTPDLLKIAEAARKAQGGTAAGFGLFGTSADVILVPGFLASQLRDVTGDNGLIWIDPRLVLNTTELLALKLAATNDDDATAATVRPDGAIPILYAGLRLVLRWRGYSVTEFGFDWRKHVDASAVPLAELIRARAGAAPRPLHLVAHSQGSLVARRALQILGPELGRQLVTSLVLLGPATAGSFSAAFGIAGSHEMLDTVRRFGVVPPEGFTAVLQSMSGLYQLLPWLTETVDGSPPDKAIEWVRQNFPADKRPGSFGDPQAWHTGVDGGRLHGLHGWAATIDASYLHDQTTIILGDAPTAGGAMWVPDPKKPGLQRLEADPAYATTGDGTVPESMARIAGVSRVFKAAGAEHMMLPATGAVIRGVCDILAGRTPSIQPAGTVLGVTADTNPTAPLLVPPASMDELFGGPTLPPAPPPWSRVPKPAAPAAAGRPMPGPTRIAEVSPPPTRRLKVFSFDPIFAARLENVGVAELTVTLPWEFADGDRLLPGPVGEYLEVVDFDASADCFYPPVDLNHPHILAQEGIPVSEGDPRFHQQMVYAVAMATIHQFEVALGRVSLWAPNLPRDEFGEVKTPAGHRRGDDYVGRLRVYPHAMRQANAFYSPAQKSLQFGYFPADGGERGEVGENLPGGTVFSCLSFDIVAHETTHALLDGLHRYLTQPSNVDVYAFHEAFADLVALLQHFSHPEVLRHQIAATAGRLDSPGALGDLAQQFGQATGHGRALREYLGRRNEDGTPVKIPDRAAIQKLTEPHARGALLVAAVFRAFVNVYDSRVKDLRGIATGGTGILPAGDLHPDLVSRLADEAATAARHLLRMCVRALDYVPPVDLTFGEYLRALVTADYDLVRDDDRRYRLSVISAFREYGIYPKHVPSLSVDSLLWSPPEEDPLGARKPLIGGLKEFFRRYPVGEWTSTSDRREVSLRMQASNAAFHDWLADPEHLSRADAPKLGLALDRAKAPGGIRRKVKEGDKVKKGDEQLIPMFEVIMFRPLHRVGPDGQQLTDVVVEIVQRRKAFFDEARQEALDDLTGDNWSKAAYDAARPDFYFRGGCTLVIDLGTATVRYCVRKSILNEGRLKEERAFRTHRPPGATASYLDGGDNNSPFAELHTGH